MSHAQRYPLDFDSIDKGSVIPAETIGGILGVSPASSAYSPGQVDLCFRIKKELADRGRDVTVVNVRDEIHVLHDPEASDRNRLKFRKRLRGMKRDHDDLMRVDRGVLSPDERREHDRAVIVQGAILVSIREAKKQINLPYARKTPGLPNTEGATAE